MPKTVEFTTPDGRTGEFDIPDGTADVQGYAKSVTDLYMKTYPKQGQAQTNPNSTPTTTPDQPKKSFWDNLGDNLAAGPKAAGDLLQGVGSVPVNMGVSAYNLARMIPGAADVLPAPSADVQAATKPPDTVGGKIGQFAGEAASYLAPGPAEAELAAGAGRLLPGVGGKLLSTGSKMLTGAGTGAAIAGLQSNWNEAAMKTAGVLGGSVPAVSATLSALKPATVSAIQNLGEKLYGWTMLKGGGTKANKIVATEVVPEMIQRGVTAISNGSLANKIATNKIQAGQTIEAIEDKLVSQGATTNLNAIVHNFQSLIQDKFLKSGSVPAGLEGEYQAYDKVLNDLMDRATSPTPGTSLFQKIIALRRDWDKAVDRKSGFQLDTSGITEAMEDGANAIRQQFSKQFPELMQPNAEYHLWAGAKKIIEDTATRKVGHAALPLATSTAVLSSAVAHSNPEQVVLHSIAAGALGKLMESTALHTMSAVGLDRIGTLLASRQWEPFLRYTGAALKGAASNSNKNQQLNNPTAPTPPGLPDSMPLPSSKPIASAGDSTVTPAATNNNPGNLRAPGSTTGFQKFDSPQAGFQALVNDIQAKQTGKTRTGLDADSNLAHFAKVYAPAKDKNNPIVYAQGLAKTLGVPVTTPIGAIPAPQLAAAIAHNEDNSYWASIKDTVMPTQNTP